MIHTDRRKTISATQTPHRPPAAAILAVPVVVALVLTLFAWPNARLEPRDLPIGVAGPPPAAEAIEKRLAQQEGAFDLQRYGDEAAARAAIEDRDVYGAFVATPSGPKVLTASAASPAVAQLLTQAASETRAATEDVVEAGLHATALGSSVLPLVIAGILTGIAGVLLSSTALGRAGRVLLASVLDRRGGCRDRAELARSGGGRLGRERRRAWPDRAGDRRRAGRPLRRLRQGGPADRGVAHDLRWKSILRVSARLRSCCLSLRRGHRPSRCHPEPAATCCAAPASSTARARVRT